MLCERMEKVINLPSKFDIKVKIIEAVFDRNQLFSVRELIRNHIEQDRETFFETPEMEWLSYKIDFIMTVLDNKNASGIFYWIKKDGGVNAYTISKRLGIYYRAVQHWIKKFRDSGLIRQQATLDGEGNCYRYYLNDRLHNITALIFELMEKQYGNSAFKLFHKHDNVQWRAIKNWREKNPEKEKQHRSKPRRY